MTDCVIQNQVSTGNVQVTGLKTAGRFTEVVINDTTWTALPSSALGQRNALSIQNRSGKQMKVNYDSSVSTYTGMIVDNGSERFYDITDDITLYGKCDAGTATIYIEELA